MHGTVNLPNMRPGETVELVLRRHWIVYVFLGLYFTGAVILSVIVWIFFGVNPYFNMMLVCFWMWFALFLFIEWLNHELDMYVVSNNRVIWIEQISFLNRAVSECNLWQVQEVNSSTKGLLSNILNYGTLSLQTAGKSTSFTMEYCPDVIWNARIVLNTVDHYRDVEAKNRNSHQENKSIPTT